ncbi:MAG: HAD family hydrolase [Planctomycetota bacterium]|jgi:beta-phosphoglucomutase
MLQAVIFDFDGVITDSEVLHLRSFNQVLAQYGVRIETKDYYRDYLGLTDVDLFKEMVGKGLLKVDSTKIEILLKQKKQAFEKLAKTEGRIIEGVRHFLQILSQNNIKIAICSGALLVEIELILQEANLRSFFEVIVAADHVRKGKPNPEGFLLTLRKLNEKSQTEIAAGNCIVVEDSHWGLEAAIAAKMHTVAVTNSYDADQLKQAEKIVPQLDQLTITDLQQLCS